jgi:hypothetical protein
VFFFVACVMLFAASEGRIGPLRVPSYRSGRRQESE